MTGKSTSERIDVDPTMLNWGWNFCISGSFRWLTPFSSWYHWEAWNEPIRRRIDSNCNFQHRGNQANVPKIRDFVAITTASSGCTRLSSQNRHKTSYNPALHLLSETKRDYSFRKSVVRDGIPREITDAPTPDSLPGESDSWKMMIWMHARNIQNSRDPRLRSIAIFSGNINQWIQLNMELEPGESMVWDESSDFLVAPTVFDAVQQEQEIEEANYLESKHREIRKWYREHKELQQTYDWN